MSEQKAVAQIQTIHVLFWKKVVQFLLGGSGLTRMHLSHSCCYYRTWAVLTRSVGPGFAPMSVDRTVHLKSIFTAA